MEYVGIFMVVFFGAFTVACTGFGFGLVTMGILPFFMPLKEFAVPFVAVYSSCVALLVTIQMRHHLSWRRLQPLIVGCVIGAPFGLLFLTTFDPSVVKRTLGIFLISYCLWSLTIATRLAARAVSDLWGYVAGVAGGILGAAFNTGGPPAVVYATLKAWNKDATKSTLQFFFFSAGLIQLSVFAAEGILTGDILVQNVLAFPAIPIGIWVGTLVYDRVNQATFRVVMLLVLLAVGLNFAIRG